MKAIYINTFLKSASYVFEQFQLPFQIGTPYLKSSPFTGFEVFSVVGITGDIRGQMYLSGSVESMLKIVSVLMGQVRSKLDSIEQSAVSEFSSIICGNAISIFSKEGMSLDITPPVLICGTQIEISVLKMNLLSIPIILDEQNKVEMGVILQNQETNLSPIQT